MLVNDRFNDDASSSSLADWTRIDSSGHSATAALAGRGRDHPRYAHGCRIAQEWPLQRTSLVMKFRALRPLASGLYFGFHSRLIPGLTLHATDNNPRAYEHERARASGEDLTGISSILRMRVATAICVT
ncbi:hypothetical protein CERZMDRAFT_89838 [Cercospora zeae-maydis SCOH1-5]|uniref:Uncharacterized protein n=1 Tax=Cercospora zeae-maydis SCOH1-5 TaxID=717836 RepID=A0A6A6FSH8_9PEZI|nr:hypothetical protein CERZMDRAFT_89838 [Cercospora zeae-maydis SCOH1-5]